MKVGDVSMRLMLDVTDAVRNADAGANALAGFGAAGKKAVADFNATGAQAGAAGAQLSKAAAEAARGATVSAGQTAMAWRMLPQQLQDVAVSLQGGMSPFTVLMQQGPQITSAFGGVGATFEAVAAKLGPVGFAVAGVVAVVGTAAVAFARGRAEADAYSSALINTGNAAGLALWQLQAMDRTIGGMAGFTRGQAAEALAVMAGAAGNAGTGIEKLTVAALRAERDGGQAITDTAKAYRDLAAAPLDTLLKLNQGTNFLTVSTYAQVKALMEQGRTQEAARVAQEAYAESIGSRAGQLEGQLGMLSRMWRDVSGDARKAWDAMAGVGRADNLNDKLDAAEARLAQLRARKAAGYSIFDHSLGQPAKVATDTKAAEEEVARLRAAKAFDAQIAKQDAARAAQAKAVTEADKDISALHRQTDAVGTLSDALAKYRAQVAAVAGTPLAVSAAQQARDIQAIRAQHVDQQALGLQNAKLDAELEAARRAADKKAQIVQKGQAELAHLRTMGLVSEADAAAQSAQLEVRSLRDQEALINQQIAIERRRPNPAGDPVQEAQRANRIAGLMTQLDQLNGKIGQVQASAVAKNDEIALARTQGLATQWASAMQQTQQQVNQWTDQAGALAVAMIEQPVAAALAQAELTTAQMEREAARMRTEYGALITQLRASGMGGAADALQGQLDKGDAQRAATERAMRQKVVYDYLKDSVGGLAAGWDRVTQAIGGSVKALVAMNDEEVNYRAALKAAGKDQARIAAVQARHAQAELHNYAAITDAAKGYFREGSKGYRAMDAASKVFRAAELAMAVKSALQKIGLIQAETATKVVGDQTAAASSATAAAAETASAMQAGAANATAAVANQAAKGDPYTAWVRMAAMVAAMAALGYAVSGGGGGGANVAAERQAATGTGTVLGDPTAKSKSIENAIGLLKDVDTMTMRYSAQMLAALSNIEASMAGVTTQILRTGKGITTGTNMGIQTGLIARNQGDPLLQGSGIPGLKLLDNMTRSAPIIGPILNRLTGLWGKTTREIIDAGIALNGTAADLAAGRGAAQYATVETRRSSWFGLSKSRSTEEVRQALDAGITAQFAKIFSGVGDSLVAASRAFGQPVDTIRQQLAGYVIDIQHLSLKGLSAEDMKTAIAAAVGAQADRMAQSVRPGLEAFQRVGEGYYETVIRTASASEQAGQALSKLGLGVVSLSAVANKQAEDLGAEMVRESILAKETTRVYGETISRSVRGLFTGARTITIQTFTDVVSGIGEIMATLDGSASDLADAYKTLTGARQTMQLLGISAAAMGRDVIAGAGSLDALTSGLSAFEESILTDQERTQVRTARLAASFAAIGQQMPADAAGYAALVRGIDTSTEAGRRLLGQVLTLADAFGQLQQDGKSAQDVADERAGLERQLLEAQGDTAALRKLDLEQVSEANRALQLRIWALKDEQERLTALANAGKGIGSVIDELTGGAAASAGASLARARAAYDRDLAAARAGDTTASSSIASTARALIEQVKANAQTPWELAAQTALISEQLRQLPAYIAAQQQQAGSQVGAGIAAAADSTAQASQAAQAAATAAAQGAATQQRADTTADEVRALRETCATLLSELKLLRSGQDTGMAAISNASRRAADALEDAMGSDGASFAVMVKGG